MAESDIHQRLAQALPDIPKWLDARSMLLSGACELYGLDERSGMDFVARDVETRLACVVGWPAREAIAEAALDCREVLAQFDNRGPVVAALPGWRQEGIVLYVLGSKASTPITAEGTVRLLEPHEVASLAGLPPELRSEFAIAVRRSPLAASIVDGAPVSFCYAEATESLWDVSIDTLEPYRRRGYAMACVSFMIGYMRRLGKEPVWGARESNLPSLRLAAKLGFEAVDRIVVLQPPE